MRAAWKQHELRTGNDRREQASLVGAHGEVVAAMDDQRRNPKLPEQIAPVAAPVERFVVARRRLRIGRDALQLVEMRNEFPVGVGTEELTGEHLPERGRIPAPAFANERHERTVFFRIVARPRLSATAVAAVQDQMADASRMLQRVRRRGPSSLGDAQERRALDADGRQHGVQIELPSLFGKVACKSIRETHPAAVVAHDRVMLRQPFPEPPEVRQLPLHFEMREVAEDADDARTGSDRRVRERHAIGRRAEPDVLLAGSWNLARLDVGPVRDCRTVAIYGFGQCESQRVEQALARPEPAAWVVGQATLDDGGQVRRESLSPVTDRYVAAGEQSTDDGAR